MDDFRLLTFAAIGVPSLILALWYGGKWEEKNPAKLGFKWGYFVIYSTLINNILLFGFVIWIGIQKEEIGLFLFGLVAMAASLAVAYFSIQRHRWALVLSTLLSLNPIWMVINIFYLKNRWGEFQSEGLTSDGQTIKKRLQKLSRDMRLALFAAISWGVCVPSYVFLFKPYGRYMRDDDTFHMIGVIFIPIIVGVGLFSIYRKFVR